MDDPLQRRSYWRWSKQDFLPEESFQSWSSYVSALSQTWFRFKDRLMSRSDDATETVQLRKQSENDMKRCLSWWDLIWFGFGAVVGAGIFVLTGQEAHNHAGPAIVLSYAVSGLQCLQTKCDYVTLSTFHIPKLLSDLLSLSMSVNFWFLLGIYFVGFQKD